MRQRKIEGLDIKFKNFEDLIATAIIIGSAKSNFSGSCANNSPFHITAMGGDIEVGLSE